MHFHSFFALPRYATQRHPIPFMYQNVKYRSSNDISFLFCSLQFPIHHSTWMEMYVCVCVCLCACNVYVVCIYNVLQMLNAKWHYSTRTIVVDDEEQPINLHSFNILDFSPVHTPDYHANDNLTLIFEYSDYLRYTHSMNEYMKIERKRGGEGEGVKYIQNKLKSKKRLWKQMIEMKWNSDVYKTQLIKRN